MIRECIYWDDVAQYITMLQENIEAHPFCKLDSVFGVPRGGLIPAVALSNRLKLPLINHIGAHTLICEDIIDSGQTIAQIPRPRWVASLLVREGLRLDYWPTWYARTCSPDVWFVFPWEDPRGPTKPDRRWRYETL